MADDLKVMRHAFILCCGKCGKRSRVDITKDYGRCPHCNCILKHYRQVTESEAKALTGKGLPGSEISLGEFQREGVVTTHSEEIPEDLKRAFSVAIDRARRSNPRQMGLRDKCRKRGEIYSVQGKGFERAVRRVRSIIRE